MLWIITSINQSSNRSRFGVKYFEIFKISFNYEQIGLLKRSFGSLYYRAAWFHGDLSELEASEVKFEILKNFKFLINNNRKKKTKKSFNIMNIARCCRVHDQAHFYSGSTYPKQANTSSCRTSTSLATCVTSLSTMNRAAWLCWRLNSNNKWQNTNFLVLFLKKYEIFIYFFQLYI